jgi:cell division protein FtsB
MNTRTVSNFDPAESSDVVQNAWQFLPWLGTAVAGALAWLTRMLLATQVKRIEQLEATCSVQQVDIDRCTHEREELKVELKGLSKDLEYLKQKLQA